MVVLIVGGFCILTDYNWNSSRIFNSVCNSEKCVDFTKSSMWMYTSQYITMDMCWNELVKNKICERRNFGEHNQFDILCENGEWYNLDKCIKDNIIQVEWKVLK